MASPKLAFIKLWSFSHTNQIVIDGLTKCFPSYEIDVIDVGHLAKRRSIPNLMSIGWFYGFDILRGTRKISTCAWRTPYIYWQIKEAVKRELQKENYRFTFQTQSMFDGSISGTPHFIYTDNTHLAQLDYPYIKKEDIGHRSWLKLERMIYENARLVFTMSSNVSRSIVERYSFNPEKAVCVYVGSNADMPTKVALNTDKYGSKNILFVGVYWERKGGPVLAEAFKEVLKVHPDAQLTIVGCSPELHIKNCSVVGRVSLQEVSNYYENACVFCLPTLMEPFGIVFIEAMNHRLPVVGTNFAAMPDFISHGENGYMIEPGNVKQLADALIDLVGNKHKCQEFGENGNRIVMEKYTWDKTFERIRENIESVLSDPAS